MFDTFTLVGAVLKRDSIPEQALLKARAIGQLPISDAVEAELRVVLRRRKFDRCVTREEREEFIGFIAAVAAPFDPTGTVVDCRDPDGNMYQELTHAASVSSIVSRDIHLLKMDPRRGIRVSRPARYLELP